MPFDYASQRNETEATFAELSRRVSIPETIRLDLQFIAAEGADYAGMTAAAEAAGFEVDPMPEFDEVELHVAMEAPTAAAIATQERRASEIALAHGFQPDGWGFLADPGPGLLSRLWRALGLSRA